MVDPPSRGGARIVRDPGRAVVCVVADNPGPLTLDGTRTYVVGSRAPVILDPGPEDDRHLAAIGRVVAGRPVRAVCLTHSHPDHAAAARAAQRWGPIHASAAALSRLGIVGGVPLADGDELDLDGGRRLRALETPGHSGDHLCFLDLPSRGLFTGDLVLGSGSSMVAFPDGSVSAYLASLARLVSLRPTRLFPGHGDPVDDAVGRLEAYRRHRLERSAQVREALRRGASSAGEVLAAVYGPLPAGVKKAAELSTLAHLQHLREMGELLPFPLPGETGDR